ncbi:hypothetical protein JCM10207_005599 [Rhodosporidiobolus poonsookiae]
MHCTPSTSSTLVALMATALLASHADALPAHRSTSSVTRRAHLASHHARSAGAGTALGDHSIVVDASTANANGQGGIRNSTINLTSISKKRSPSSSDGALSSFARVVRSLFSASASEPVQPVVPASVVPSSSASSPSTHQQRKKRSTAPSNRIKRLPHAQRAAAAAGAKAKRAHFGAAVHAHVPNSKRAARQRNRYEERAIMYTQAAAQQSAYSAAVAALGDDQPTASPVINAVVAPTSTASPEVAAASYAATDSNSTSSAVVEPDVERPPITLTMTLVAAGPNGEYIDAAALPTITSSSAENPNATPSASSAAASSAASSAAEEELETVTLSASSSASAAPSASATAGFAKRRVRPDGSRVQHARRAPSPEPRKVNVGVAVTSKAGVDANPKHAAAAAKPVWYKAEH